MRLERAPHDTLPVMGFSRRTSTWSASDDGRLHFQTVGRSVCGGWGTLEVQVVQHKDEEGCEDEEREQEAGHVRGLLEK